jgi:hypothetical protein
MVERVTWGAARPSTSAQRRRHRFGEMTEFEIVIEC